MKIIFSFANHSHLHFQENIIPPTPQMSSRKFAQFFSAAMHFKQTFTSVPASNQSTPRDSEFAEFAFDNNASTPKQTIHIRRPSYFAQFFSAAIHFKQTFTSVSATNQSTPRDSEFAEFAFGNNVNTTKQPINFR